MKFLENKALQHALTDRLRELYGQPLGGFPHVTQLIYCLSKSYWDKCAPLGPLDSELMLFATGAGLERVLIDPEWKAEAKQKDGIWYSVDFKLLGRLGELKTTRISANRATEELPQGWLRQMMAYCHAEGEVGMDLAVLHLMGTWRPPFPLPPKCWFVEFELAELWENWQWLLGRKQVLDGMLSRGEALAGQVCESWECPLRSKKAKCRYQMRCEMEEG